MNETLNVLDRRWRGCCKALLRQEVGHVWEFDDWLSGMIDRTRHEKSCVSGKDVTLGIKEYAAKANFISLDEIDFGKKYAPVPIGKIDSIRSLLPAISDRVAYCGNTVIGKCGNVEQSAVISDSFFVYDCAHYGDSKYLYKCTTGRVCEDCFGTHGPGESQFCVRCTQTYKDSRCFECWLTQNCSDCYYSFNITNCNDCIFCFNLHNKKNCIGNLELPREKYLAIKKRLLGEFANRLKKEKKLPSLMDIVVKCAYAKPKIPPQPDWRNSEGGKDKVEKEFTSTCKLLFDAPLVGIDTYSEWLLRHTHRMVKLKSAVSGKKVITLPYATALPAIPYERVITIEEAKWLGENSKINEKETAGLTLENAHKSIAPIAFFAAEFCEGENSNLTDCSIFIDNSYCYLTSAMVYSKYCACGMWPRSSEHCFGFDTLWNCSFCMKCYHSVKLTRCFECDFCHSCTDSYFCHNCENCHDCMFCFNAKNLKYAIGNVEYLKEEYLQAKKKIIGEIIGRLEKEKKLDISIYNIGAK